MSVARRAAEPAPGARAPTGQPPGTTDLARRMREAREAAGLTLRELAAAAGVSAATLVGIEQGAEPRHRSLLGLARALPALSAADLLGVPDRWAPVASSSVWAHFRDAWGLVVRRVRVTATAAGQVVEVRGLRPLQLSLESTVVRTALMRSAAESAAPELLRAVEARPSDMRWRRRVEQDERWTHEWTFPRDLTRGLTYRRTPRGEAEPGLERPTDPAIRLAWPVEKLELREGRPSGGASAPPRLLAWPAAVPLDATSDIAAQLYPAGVPIVESRLGATVKLVRPLPGLRYALAWNDAVGRGVRARRRSWSLGAVARDAREGQGLSLRGAATEAGITAPTWLSLERRGSATRSTVRAVLRVGPHLSPQELLPTEPTEHPPRDLANDEMWEYVARLHGFEAAEVTKILTVRPDGSSRCRIETVGLRSRRGSLRDLRLRAALQRTVIQASPTVLASIEAKTCDDVIKTRTLRRTDGHTLHELRFPRRLTADGITYVRRYVGVRYYLRRRAMASALDVDGEAKEGASLPVWHPTRSARLIVRLPLHVSDIQAHVWPLSVHPDPDLPCLAVTPRLPPPVVRRLPGGRSEIALAAEHPLPGLRLGVAWSLPD